MANMKDLAHATGLSLATISRVFSDSDKVRPKTRQLVLKVAKELNYQPNKMAAALRSGKSKTVGVIVPIIDREVFSAAIKNMEEQLSKYGYHLIICQSHESYEKEKKIIENLKQLRVDGVIISVSKETTHVEHIQSLVDLGVKVVLFDRTIEIGQFNTVVINNFNGAYQATAHLIAQKCKRIIHLAGAENVAIFKERIRGFEAAIREHQLPFNADNVIPFDGGTPENIEKLKQLFNSDTPPDGIFAHGDIAALVALNILDELQLEVPKDVAIIGFGNSIFCSYLKPRLSSVDQMNENIGTLAASVLLGELNSEDSGDLVIPRKQMLPAKLVIRNSSLKST